MTPRPQQAPRIIDVARVAGVSPQTVSNVLNDRGGFTPETRQRVLDAVEQLRFIPNRAARELRTRRSGQIGLHVPVEHISVINPFTVSFLRAVVSAVEGRGQQLIILTHPLDAEMLATSRIMQGLDGVIMCNVDPADPRPERLARAGIPFSVFGRVAAGLPQACVDIDNAAAMTEMTEYLVRSGRRTFAYAGYNEHEFWNVDRLDGVRSCLRSHGLELPDTRIARGSLHTIRAQLNELLDPPLPDVIVCASDSMAAIAHSVALQRGLVPGRDLALTGFDGLPMTIDLDPTLTSVAIPLQPAADLAVDMLMQQIDGKGAPAAGVILETRLHFGQSA